MAMEFLDGLNAEQRRAATAPDGPVMIVAGPGTGKTGTLAARVAWLLATGRAGHEEVVALTFTVKAAREMRDRVTRLVGAEAAVPEVTTFHGLAMGLLGEVRTERRLVDEAERREVLRGLARPDELVGLSVRELGLGLSRERNRAEASVGPWGELAAAYGQALAERGAWDFDDVLGEALALVRADGGRRYRYVLVDEFQDTSEVQYGLARALAEGGSLLVIGDPRQSIYGFRGAGGAMFERFGEDFPAHTTVTLGVNYRSERAIVAAGNAVFGDGPALTPAAREPGRVRVVQCLGEHAEAAWIVGEIEAELGGTTMLGGRAEAGSGASFRDFAVVYRTHRLGRAVQRRLEEAGMPYQVAGEGSPYERPAVVTVVGELRAMAGRDGFEAAPAELARVAAVRLGLGAEASERRDVAQLVATLARFEALGPALAYLDELAQSEFYDPAAEAVTLLTIHAAKGLEFGYVFVCGVEEGWLPLARPGLETDVEEERRLFYVAVTRAQRRLDVTYTKGRGGQLARLSRFAAGLPAGVAERVVDPAMAAQARKRERRRAQGAQGTLF